MATYTGALSALVDGTFLGRIVVGITDVAEDVLEEPAATPFHSERVVLAKKVVEGNELATEAAAKTLVKCNSEALDVNAPDKGLTDTAIKAAVAAQWNTLAGIDQGT